MDGSNFLIIGSRGQLGSALKIQYSKATAVDIEELDITNEESVKNYDWSKVGTILNAAGYTNVDGAETPEGQKIAKKVNAEAAASLAEVAKKHGLTLVHISTDYVFDGSKNPHTEDEPFSPLSVYGKTKAEGDKAVTGVPKHYLVRTSWVIGEGKNFVRTMLELGKQGVNPTVVADQVGRPTFTSELVRAIDHLLKIKAPYGTYNVSNSGQPISWADFTRSIFKVVGFNLQVTDTTTAEYSKTKPNVAPRPPYSTLDLSKMEAAGFKFRDWQDDLREYIKKELQ
jgi:dTDP-4-dehydrorhamnose 3,5-epimerase/reductase